MTRYDSITRIANLVFPFFLIITIGIICYSVSFDASFTFDDIPSIINNESIKDLWDLKTIWQANETRFLAFCSFAINYHIHGLNLFGYHLVNLIIHILAALTLYWMGRLLFLTPEMKENPLSQHAESIALAVSLVFVSHPVETQAVTYIVQRMTSMVTLFYLLSLVLYIKARIHYDEGDSRHIPFYVGSITAALLAMFTKEISVTLPLCILACEYFFFSPSLKKIGRKLSYLWPMLLTLPIVPLTYILTKKEVMERVGLATLMVETDSISRLDYLLTQFNVISTYIRLLFLPIHQSVDYDYPVADHFFEPATFASFLLLFSILVLALILFKRYRLISFGIVWFFLTLIVESSLIPIRDVIFEHRLYLPSVGIFLSSIVLVFHLLGHRRKILFALFALVISLASVATINRNIVWKRQVLLWHDVVKKAPHKSRGYLNRGVGYSDLNKSELALRDYNLAVSMNKNDPTPYFNRGLIYMDKGEYESAVSEFNTALRLQPNMAKAYANRGLTYMAWEKYDEAYKDFYTAIRLKPQNPAYLNAIGTACHKLQRYNLARLAFTKTMALYPDFATPYLNRGKTLRTMGRFKAAIKDFNRAVELALEIPEIYYQRGLTHVALSQYKRAIADFTEAITRDPTFVKAYNNRGMAYHRLSHLPRALIDLNKAIELDSSLATLYRNRAEVYQSLGKQREATIDIEKAEELEDNQKGGKE